MFGFAFPQYFHLQNCLFWRKSILLFVKVVGSFSWKRTTSATSLGVFFKEEGGRQPFWVLWGLVSSLGCRVLSHGLIQDSSSGAVVGSAGFPQFPIHPFSGVGCGLAFFPLQFLPAIHYRLIFIILSPGQAWRYFKPWWEAWREESQTHPQAEDRKSVV